jgi:hypothetical protein
MTNFDTCLEEEEEEEEEEEGSTHRQDRQYMGFISESQLGRAFPLDSFYNIRTCI